VEPETGREGDGKMSIAFVVRAGSAVSSRMQSRSEGASSPGIRDRGDRANLIR